MAQLNLQLQGLDSIQRMQRFLQPATFDKAQSAGIIYASKAVPPVVAKGIGAAYNIKAARIKRDIKTPRITSTAAVIPFERTPPTLTQYGARPGTRGQQAGQGRGLGWAAPSPRGKPVTATILRSQGRRPIPGAFMITGTGGSLVAVRRNATTGKLEGVHGPSVGSIFLGNSKLAATLQAATTARINEQFEKGFQRSIDAAARGYGQGK